MLKRTLEKKEKLTLINVKVTKAEKAAIQRRARMYADGNVSEWLRYAGSELSPRKKDIATVKPERPSVKTSKKGA